MLGGGAAAAADDAEAVALDEVAEHVGQRLGLGREDRLAARGPGGGCRRWGCSGSACELCSPRKRTASRMSSGPVEQLRPMTSTSSASSVVSAALMSVPSSILPPFGSRETEAWIGTARPTALNASRAPKTAALTSRMSCAVSMMIRSTPPSTRPRDCSSKTVDEVAEADRAERRVVGGGEEAGGADRAGHEVLLADRLAGDLGGLAVDLERVLAEAPLLELEAGALERVGLDHLGARLDHRGVELLDDVGAVEHERLVAAPGELVVVLEREVELLERGAHRAVEDDHAVAGGCQEIAHEDVILAQPCQTFVKV